MSTNDLKNSLIRQCSELNFLVGDQARTAVISNQWKASENVRGAWKKAIDSFSAATYSIMQCYYTEGTHIEQLLVPHRTTILILSGELLHNSIIYKSDSLIIIEANQPQQFIALKDVHLIMKLDPKLSPVYRNDSY